MTAALLSRAFVLLRWLLVRASRTSSAYRAALSKDLCVELSTGDGASMRFVVLGRRFVREASARPPDLALHFSRSLDALAFLTARDPLARMLDGRTASGIHLSGNPMLLIWFQGRVQEALPLARLRRHRVRLPGSVTEPIVGSRTRHRVERLPAVSEIHSDWPAAIAAREALYMVQVARGQPVVPF